MIVLSYHNIVPTSETPTGDRSLHLPQQDFARQLDHLVSHYDVVRLNDLPRARARGSRRPRAVITFDDAYAGALTAGLAELVARRLPATVFVSPSFLGGGAFWWDMLASPTGLSTEFRDVALTDGRGLTDEILRIAGSRGTRANEPAGCARCAGIDVLDAAVATGLVSVGSHTLRHPNLTMLTDDELDEELRASRAWVRRYSADWVDAIAYPYGLANERVHSAAASAGYSMSFMVTGGWGNAASLNGFGIPRLNVPAGISLDGFAARVAGVRISP